MSVKKPTYLLLQSFTFPTLKVTKELEDFSAEATMIITMAAEGEGLARVTACPREDTGHLQGDTEHLQVGEEE